MDHIPRNNNIDIDLDLEKGKGRDDEYNIIA